MSRTPFDSFSKQFLGDIFNSAGIAINELPVTPETLWIRLLGRGQTQRQAIAETLALPPDDRRRDIVLELLSNWKINLGISTKFEQEEPELMAQLSQAYLDWRRETEQGGIERGIEQERRALVTLLLERKVGALPEQTRDRISRLTLNQLEGLAIALLEFTTVEDLEAWLSNAT